MATETIKSVNEFDAIPKPPCFNAHAFLGKARKRLLDLLISGVGLLTLSPVFLVIALLIKRNSPGPVFYRGRRLGRGGKIFEMLKFRTMHECPDSYKGACITAKDDQRITPLGRWLRDSKINEFPQLWNVFKGEMSLVGPRPEDPEVARTWPRAVFQEILSVRPGITSPASVLYRHEEKMLSTENVMDEYLRNIMPNKLRLDLLYVRTRSFLGDLDVIMWTLIALLPQTNRRLPPETDLYAGPLVKLVRRYLSWFMVDIIVALGATGVVGVLWRMSAPLNVGIGMALGLAAGIGLVFGLINSLLGLKLISWRTAKASHVFDLALSSGLATGLVFLADWFWPSGPFLSPGMILTTGLVAFLGFVAVRYRQRLLTGLASRWLQIHKKAGSLGERVLIIGAGECGMLATWLLEKSKLASHFSVVGMVDDDLHKQGMRVDGHLVLGGTNDIPTLVREKNIGVIMYAISNIDPAEEHRILELCQSVPARLIVIPNLIKILQEYLLNPDPDKPKPKGFDQQGTRRYTEEAGSVIS